MRCWKYLFNKKSVEIITTCNCITTISKTMSYSRCMKNGMKRLIYFSNATDVSCMSTSGTTKDISSVLFAANQLLLNLHLDELKEVYVFVGL